ncbi:uncharacterized protein LOC123317014 isoform X2 [Coccinella septempunctata]|uniref:uncharacterized protein LOC123317014 isoform X2 n=1 Tax=Coccinella septempunctata TaxID=41139 RepID=UPI001D08A13A|nr:uncharacterized protein LOC123317014 isoform X2 [Coccinella septempunctata]
MRITILFLVVSICVCLAKTPDAGKKAVTKKENPIDMLLYLANSLLRGDVIACLTKIVEVVQRQDTGLLLEVVLILTHRFLTILQPIFYIIFPSTKDKGGMAMNFKTRVQTISHLMGMIMESTAA